MNLDRDISTLPAFTAWIVRAIVERGRSCASHSSDRCGGTPERRVDDANVARIGRRDDDLTWRRNVAGGAPLGGAEGSELSVRDENAHWLQRVDLDARLRKG